MEWDENSGVFSAHVNAEHPMNEALQQLSNCLVQRVIPLNVNVHWDCIRFEIWPDSGRIIAFPAAALVSRRIEKAACQIVVLDILSRYNELADSNFTDEVFESELQKLYKLIEHELLVVLQGTQLRSTRIVIYYSDSTSPSYDSSVP